MTKWITAMGRYETDYKSNVYFFSNYYSTLVILRVLHMPRI